jgi:signal transduction histidine kinase
VIRRILFAQVTLLILVLVSALVPVGLSTAADDRAAFLGATIGAARSLATVAEENLDDKRAAPQLPTLLSRLVVAGDTAMVVRRDGSVLAAAGDPPQGRPLLATALSGRTGADWRGSGDNRRILVGVPVGGQDPPVGAVLLTRPTGSLDRAVHHLWLLLAGIAAAATLAGGAAALTLARWVGRPVRRLETTVRSLGDNDLAVRAAAESGPPEIRQLAIAFNAMAARLETVVHGHRAVIADVSHQLRTPLAAVRLRLELLADEADGTHITTEAVAALAELGRLSRLVDGMLAVARGENTAPRPEEVQVGTVAIDRVDAWRPMADEAAVCLRSNVTDGLVATMTAGHLEQVLDNLLDNAITATPAGGTVTVTAEPAADFIRLVVADDGPGMDPHRQAEAFHRFSDSVGGGTGLGLAIVHRLITADGGQASLHTAGTGGLAVTLLLRPAHEAGSGAEPQPGANDQTGALPIPRRLKRVRPGAVSRSGMVSAVRRAYLRTPR